MNASELRAKNLLKAELEKIDYENKEKERKEQWVQKNVLDKIDYDMIMIDYIEGEPDFRGRIELGKRSDGSLEEFEKIIKSKKTANMIKHILGKQGLVSEPTVNIRLEKEHIIFSFSKVMYYVYLQIIF